MARPPMPPPHARPARAPLPAVPLAGCRPSRVRVTALALITGALLAGWVGIRLVPSMATTPTALSYAENYPVCASAWLRSAPHDLRIFNQYGEGGYLSWSLAGTGDRIFIFGDAALMGDSMLYTYSDVADVAPQWESILLRYGTQVVLFDTGTALDHVLAASPALGAGLQRPPQPGVRAEERADLPAPPTPAGTHRDLRSAGRQRRVGIMSEPPSKAEGRHGTPRA